MSEAGLYDINSGFLADVFGRDNAGISLEDGILGAKRKTLESAVGHKWHAQIVERHHSLCSCGIQLREIHRNVGASGMSDKCKIVVIGVRLDVSHLLNGKLNIGNAAQILRLPPHIELADFRDHRRVGRQIVLNADRYITPRGKNVRQKRIVSEFDGVAMAEDRHWQLVE